MKNRLIRKRNSQRREKKLRDGKKELDDIKELGDGSERGKERDDRKELGDGSERGNEREKNENVPPMPPMLADKDIHIFYRSLLKANDAKKSIIKKFFK